MVKQCQFNDYHTHFTHELQESLLHLNECQSTIVSSLISYPVVSRDEFNARLSELQQASDSLRQAYIEARIRRIQHVLEDAATVQSEDHLSHSFFLFQLGAIARLLINATTINETKTFFQETKDAIIKKKNKKRRPIKEWLKPHWPRFISAFKSMIIIGVGSIFVMVPGLAATFENGEWIFIALCMTQGETVGGALTAMKMRLVGTLFGKLLFFY
jgi:hypothetical protein